MLLKYGASLKIGGSEECTAVHIAIMKRKVEELSTLLTLRESVALVRSQSYKLLRLAMKRSNKVHLAAIVETLINIDTKIHQVDEIAQFCTTAVREASLIFPMSSSNMALKLTKLTIKAILLFTTLGWLAPMHLPDSSLNMARMIPTGRSTANTTLNRTKSITLTHVSAC